MANDIKQRIILEGEGEYKRALQDANRNLKTLRSELKAETAELGKNATEQQKAAVKTKNLQKQIQEQEKAVKAHRDALEEVRKKYGDNEEAVAKYEQRLNNARAALASMKNELDTVDRSYDAVTDGAKRSVLENNALAESFGRIGEAASSLSGAIESAFTGIVGTIKETVTQVWASVVDLAARSNNLVDLAGFWNTDVTTIQKYKGAVADISGTLEDLSGIVTKINSKDSKTIAELTGISDENYQDKWEYAMAVMDAMSKMDFAKRNAAGFELFGKSATKAFDILNDWGKLQENLDKYDVTKDGYGLTEEELHNMSDLYDKVNGLKQSWQDLKDMATVKLFGDLALNITGNLQNILDGFKDYFNAKDDAEKQQAIQKIKDNIKAMFEAIREAFEAGIQALNDLAKELKNSDDPTSKAIGNILDSIVKALEWLGDPTNWNKIKDGIMIVLGVWLTSKLTLVAGKVLSIVANLKTISGWKAPTTLTSPTSQAAEAGAETTAGTATKTSAFAKISAWLTDAMGVSGAGMAGGVAGIAAWVAAVSAIVNSANEKARQAREVATDTNRYSGFGGEQTNYAWGGLDNRYVLESYVNSLMKTTGDTRGINSAQNILTRMAGGLGSDILAAFNYTNTSGESRNKLLDMLNMDDQNAAVAAMMLHAAGVSTRDVDYSAQYAKYEELMRSGGMGFSTALTTLTDFFDKSGSWENGRWTIPGYENTNGVMPVINGVPLANMSGYVMTSDANKRTYTGTWDPAAHMSDWWRNQGVPENQKIEMSDSSITGMKRAVADGVSGIRVYMDGVAVGHLVAPTVSEDIARAVP